jgi:flagellar basal body rod protein FlgC
MSLDLLNSAASGMDAQRAALDVAARNVAAAEAAGPNAEYERLIPDFTIAQDDAGESLVRFSGTHQERGKNVDILTEMIAVMNASRAYDSNASLFDTGKQLAEKTIELGRL